jgi:hypothetical protein
LPYEFHLAADNPRLIGDVVLPREDSTNSFVTSRKRSHTIRRFAMFGNESLGNYDSTLSDHVVPKSRNKVRVNVAGADRSLLEDA